MDRLEKFFSKAEIAYKSGKITQAIEYGKQALDFLSRTFLSSQGSAHKNLESKIVALRIFIARCHSRLGNYAESNKIYRELFNDKIYITPAVIGLLYNNLCTQCTEKLNLNLRLVKLCLLLP